MDKILELFENRLKDLEWIVNIRKRYKMLKIRTIQGIEYTFSADFDNNNNIYILENEYFKKQSKIGQRTQTNKYFNPLIIPDIFEENLLINDMFLEAFKKGMEYYKTKNKIFELDGFFDKHLYYKYRNDKKILICIYNIWKKGIEFASKYPNPDIITVQYELLKKRAIENINIETIKEFMLKNKDIHIYLDEKRVSEKAKELENVKEIEYSYGHIVAKANTYDIKMKLLPLSGEIIVFDNEGINELANCNVADYKRIYEEKIIEEMFKMYAIFEKENYVEMEKSENEQEE